MTLSSLVSVNLLMAAQEAVTLTGSYEELQAMKLAAAKTTAKQIASFLIILRKNSFSLQSYNFGSNVSGKTDIFCLFWSVFYRFLTRIRGFLA